MPCEKYQHALIDLAASDAVPDRVVRSHLAGCRFCRSYLQREQVLFATIEFGVRQSTNAPLPSSLLQRFEAGLAQETLAKIAPRRNWIYAACAAVAFLALALLILRPRTTLERIASTHTPEAPVQQKGAVGETPGAPARSSLPVAKGNVGRNPGPKRAVARAAVSAGPQVLVSTEERDAFRRFISRVGERKEVAIALVSPSPENVTNPLKVEDLQISWLEIEPLKEPELSPIAER
jgi:hypothetical protein